MRFHRAGLRLSAVTLAGWFTAQLLTAAPLPNAWQITDATNAAGSLLYYTNVLSPANQMAATNSGFHFTVNARFVDDFGDGEAMTMIYGLGSKRFLIWWGLDANNDLTARLEGGPTYTVTTNGTGRALYHTHEIIYTNGAASYLFDGAVKTNNWTGSGNAWTTGAVTWGSGSSPNKGQMNFNRVTFEVTNFVVAGYDAGTAPAVAPNPIDSGWALPPAAGRLAGTSTNAISPDTALWVALTLAPDQLANTSGRLNGQANPSGSPTVAWFEWGTDTNYGNLTTKQDVGSGLSVSNVTAVLGGLVAGPTYNYRLVVSNAFGVVSGTNQAFTLSFLLTSISGLPGVYSGS